MNEGPVRVLIADDHTEFRRGLAALLRTDPNLEIAGTAASGADTISLARELQPDLVLMDLSMPEVNGVEATQAIVTASPHIRVLVFTMFEDDDSVFAAMRAGARGYLLKGAGRDEIIRAIRTIVSGGVILGPGIAQRVAGYFSASAAEPLDAFPQLTERERDLLALVAAGKSNATIANQLFLSPKTVRNHVSNIFTKLQVADRAEAIILAREAGIGRSSREPWAT
jgi:DNA-binding NarL/FixJ family response regulator